MPPRPTTIYACAACDAQTPKWSGRCLSCGAWGTLKEELTGTDTTNKTDRTSSAQKPGTPKAFADETLKQAATAPTGIAPFDGVLGGGLVAGSVTLVAGEPGVGKSTLLAQLALIASQHGKVLYITGEESPTQVRKRLDRLLPASLLPASLFFLDERDAATIAATIEAERPIITIVDSIQSVRTDDANGEAGSVTQVKASAALLTEAAKRSHCPVILVGQVTKDGDIAGPRVLEHLVDTVLFLEGEREHRFRILRALKHRFGPTDEVALLAMTENGLTAIEDPSSELLRDRPAGVAGSCVTCLMEGHRPLLLELQALVSPAGYGTPVRRATGVDTARLGMLLAVLMRRAGVQALDKDVYANAAGGIDARDSSVDLALAAAIASAVKDAPLDPHLAMFGEIGLAGELRPVAMPDLRLKELARMGFKMAIVPRGQGKHAPAGLTTKEASTVRDALQVAGITPSTPPS